MLFCLVVVFRDCFDRVEPIILSTLSGVLLFDSVFKHLNQEEDELGSNSAAYQFAMAVTPRIFFKA